MRKFTILSIVSLLFINVFPGRAQTTLKLALKKGDKFYAEQTINIANKISTQMGDIEMPIENKVGITYEVLNENNGAADIKMTFSSMKFKSKSPMSGEDLLFDSEKSVDLDGELGTSVKKTIGQSYVFTIDANSRKIITIKDRPKKDSTVEGPSTGPMPDYQFFPKDDTALPMNVAEVFGGSVPANTLPKAGYSWGRSDTTKMQGVTKIMNTTFKVDAIQDNKINVALTIKGSTAGTVNGGEQEMKISGSSSGTGSEVIDALTGLLIEKKSITNGNSEIETPMGNQKMVNAITSNLVVKKIQ